MEAATVKTEVVLEDNYEISDCEIVESETVYDENCVTIEETIYDHNCVIMEVESDVPETVCDENFESIPVEVVYKDKLDVNIVPTVSCEDTMVEATNSSVEPITSSQTENLPKNVCQYCQKKFFSASNCFKHLTTIHKIQRKVHSTDIICIECKIPYNRVSQLREHLSRHHKLEMGEEVFRFPNMNEFNKWRGEEERKSLCKYVKNSSNKKCKDGAHHFYECHRSGKHVPKVKHRKRNMRTQGSCKLGMSCTSTITVVDSGHQVIAKYCRHHYGHGGVTTLIKITPEEQNAIAATVEKGGDFKNVLEEISVSYSDKDQFHFHVMQDKDFERIRKALATEGPNSDLTDAESLDIWVQSCAQMENSPVLLYKPEIISDEDKNPNNYFALIIMTEYQKHILLASAKKVVCIDRIHRRRGSRYYLTILLVMDEYNLAFPTAFCVSSKVDKGMILQFLETIRQHTGYLETNCLISDGEDFFYEAWKEVMSSEPKWLWNRWFVDTFWRGQLRIFRWNIEKRGEVYNNMKSLLECQSDTVFTFMLENFIKSLCDKVETKDLGKCIEQHYAPHAEKWAQCYRKDLGVDTSMHLEMLHRTLTFCTRQGVSRLDKYVFILMRLVRDKILDRLSKIEDPKLTLALSNIDWCHKAGLEIPVENVIDVSESEWKVKSPISDEMFHIALYNESCPERCRLICEECDVCVHMFTCTCFGNLINANLCEHIHAVAFTSFVPKFTPPQSPVRLIKKEVTRKEENIVSEDITSLSNMDEENPVDMLDELNPYTDERFYRALTKAHSLYSKIKSKKCNLTTNDLDRIIKNLHDCLNICDHKPLQSSSVGNVTPTIQRISLATTSLKPLSNAKTVSLVRVPINKLNSFPTTSSPISVRTASGTSVLSDTLNLAKPVESSIPIKRLAAASGNSPPQKSLTNLKSASGLSPSVLQHIKSLAGNSPNIVIVKGVRTASGRISYANVLTNEKAMARK